MVEWLNGKKSYLGLLAAGLFGLLMSSGAIEWNATTETIATLIGTWTGVGIVHKADKMIAAAKRGF